MSKLKQGFLPGFPEGALRIGEALSILEKRGQVTYFVGGDNYFSHPTTDEQSKRYVLASLMDNGHVRARDLSEPPLNIPHRTLMNWVAQLRKEGAASFYRAAKQAKPRVMTSAMSAECARLLGEGNSPAEVARQKGIEESTLRKAMKRQGIVAPQKKA